MISHIGPLDLSIGTCVSVIEETKYRRDYLQWDVGPTSIQPCHASAMGNPAPQESFDFSLRRAAATDA